MMDIITVEIEATRDNYWQTIEQIEALSRPCILILYYKHFSEDIPITWRLRATLRTRTLIIDGCKVIVVNGQSFHNWMQEWMNLPILATTLAEAQEIAEAMVTHQES